MHLLQLDWASAGRYVVADPRWKAKLWTAGLVLLIPFVGWPALLGYRREAVFRLADGASPILPDWEAGLWHYLRGGLQAVGVIHLYLSPIYLWFALRVANDAFVASVPWVPVVLFFLAAPIFTTLMIPAGLVYARWMLPALDVSEWELYALGAAFQLVVFFIPAGFLNVTRTRRMRSAFAVWPAVRLIARHPRVPGGVGGVERDEPPRPLLPAGLAVGGGLVLPRHHVPVQRGPAPRRRAVRRVPGPLLSGVRGRSGWAVDDPVRALAGAPHDLAAVAVRRRATRSARSPGRVTRRPRGVRTPWEVNRGSWQVGFPTVTKGGHFYGA
jgi:hypothetical protein